MSLIVVLVAICLISCNYGIVSIRKSVTKIIGFNKTHCVGEHILYTADVTDLNELMLTFNKVAISNLSSKSLEEGVFANLTELETLSLDENGIEGIHPGAFGYLPELKRISLVNNRLKRVRSGVFNHLNLLILMLSNNEIEYIDSGAFDNMTELISIMLGYNKIKHIDPEWFYNCNSLLTISLDGNEITQVPESAFKNINCIHFVNNNTIRTNIYMGRNKITKIHPFAFKNITEIGYIWLQDNFLTELENELFSGFHFISTLRLNKNNLTCLSDQILSDLKCAKFVNIDDNPWEPNCLSKIKSWADRNNVNL